jgi:hypothetical protein
MKPVILSKKGAEKTKEKNRGMGKTILLFCYFTISLSLGRVSNG